MRYDRECWVVRRRQKRSLRAKLKAWLRGDTDRPEPVYRNSQGWCTW